jgi:hypothetical protein
LQDLITFENLTKDISLKEKSITRFISENFKSINKLKKDLFNFLRGKTSINPLLLSKEELLEKIKFYSAEYAWERRSNYPMHYKTYTGRDKLKLCIHIYVNQELKKDLLEKTLDGNLEYKRLFKELSDLKNEKAKQRKKIFNIIGAMPYC